MGLEFGNLIRIKGITYYTISPYEQKALTGVLNPGIKNVLRRTRESLFIVGIPALTFVGIVVYLKDYHHRLNRKNPNDFINDE